MRLVPVHGPGGHRTSTDGTPRSAHDDADRLGRGVGVTHREALGEPLGGRLPPQPVVRAEHGQQVGHDVRIGGSSTSTPSASPDSVRAFCRSLAGGQADHLRVLAVREVGPDRGRVIGQPVQDADTAVLVAQRQARAVVALAVRLVAEDGVRHVPGAAPQAEPELVIVPVTG